MAATHDQPVCVIPGCDHPVTAWGQPCPQCLTAFGAHLRPTGDAPLTRAQIGARDAYIERAYYAQRRMTGGHS